MIDRQICEVLNDSIVRVKKVGRLRIYETISLRVYFDAETDEFMGIEVNSRIKTTKILNHWLVSFEKKIVELSAPFLLSIVSTSPNQQNDKLLLSILI